MDNIPTLSQRVNRSLDLLAPQVKDRAIAAISSANAAGYSIRAFETYRSPERQDALYAQGRTEPGKIVTEKQAWGSWHQCGSALDIAFWVNNTWSWKGDFHAVSKFFLNEGFEWLHPFEDVHFQIRGGFNISEAATICKTQGMLAFWIELGQRLNSKLWPQPPVP